MGCEADYGLVPASIEGNCSDGPSTGLEPMTNVNARWVGVGSIDVAVPEDVSHAEYMAWVFENAPRFRQARDLES